MTPIDTSNIDAIKAEIAAAEARMREVAQDALKDGFRQIFEEYPFLGAVRWTQYTPYFNDGDPCEFSVYEVVCASVVDEQGDDDDRFYEDGEDFYAKAGSGWLPEPPPAEPAYAACRTDVRTLVGAIPEDSLKALLGDHIRVTVTRDGLTTEEYDHD